MPATNKHNCQHNAERCVGLGVGGNAKSDVKYMQEVAKIKFEKDSGLLISTEKIYISSLNSLLNIWADADSEKQIQPTDKQRETLVQFSNITNAEFDNAIFELEKLRKILIQEKEIIKNSKPIKDFKSLLFQQLILPKQEETVNKFLLVYADTDWKFRYSKYTVELEILFTNNKFELMQESTGLWTRLEWNELYNTGK